MADGETWQQISMLRIVAATCATAVDALRAADNPVDEQLVADLAVVVERTRAELNRLTAIPMDALRLSLVD